MGFKSQPCNTLVKNAMSGPILLSSSNNIIPNKMGFKSQPCNTLAKNAMSGPILLSSSNNIPNNMGLDMTKGTITEPLTLKFAFGPYSYFKQQRGNTLNKLVHNYQPLKIPFVFQPTTSEWKKYHSDKLGMTLIVSQNTRNH
ncbi:uncharacterized protein LOC135922171 [Gordionus sp. m RMFG-2023]|uniref:uncharacterized protein LOC135922171 n=1 Tax=Gordionus sp. m RMFG-2023 TaxID=3053472 RepID=UPI0031FD36F5